MKFTRDYLEKSMGVEDLRKLMRQLGGTPSLLSKTKLIDAILKIQSGELVPNQSGKGRRPRMTDEEYVKQQGEGDYIETEVRNEIDEYNLVQDTASKGEAELVKGILEFHSDGYAFMRGDNYEANVSSDIYVSKNTINYFKLRRGDYVEGYAERLHSNSSPSLKKIVSLNGKPYNFNDKRLNFDDLTPCYPDAKIKLELTDCEDDLSIRAIDLLSPIGRGQRGLIVAPPKAGKTTLLKKIANSIEKNYSDIHLLILLIDERPEEVTDIKRSVKGEVIYSTFDEAPDHHIRLAELVLNRGKRLVEQGKHVVILLDSITKLARAYNAVVPSSGKTLSGGIDPLALQAPKKFFGSARNIENGGSLTILSTALVETGSKMDDVIYEEFKGTGNMEIILSRSLSERRIFPAIDLYKSGTRKDELLLSKEELDAVYAIRRYLDRNDDAIQNLLDMLKRTENNEEFVKKVPVWCKMMSN